jgi:hypothetical protein
MQDAPSDHYQIRGVAHRFLVDACYDIAANRAMRNVDICDLLKLKDGSTRALKQIPVIRLIEAVDVRTI